jgi:hypothetical protein
MGCLARQRSPSGRCTDRESKPRSDIARGATTDPESGVSNPISSLSNTLFPVPLRPITASVSPCRTSASVQNSLPPKRFVEFLNLNRDLVSAPMRSPHANGQMVRINRTSSTSARITNREERTTELVAVRQTPSVPLFVSIRWKEATSPMITPNTAVFRSGGI